MPSALLELRQFLHRHGCHPSQISDCELALAEAINNAIKYAVESARTQPIDVEIICSAQEIQLVVTDRTPGFEWPVEPRLPKQESETGRGVYLIQTVMDHTAYFKEPGGNRLILRKRRDT